MKNKITFCLNNKIIAILYFQSRNIQEFWHQDYLLKVINNSSSFFSKTDSNSDSTS